MDFKEFLDKYDFIRFTSEDYKKIIDYIEIIDDGEDSRPCGSNYKCDDCPFYVTNSKKGRTCGTKGGSMPYLFCESDIDMVRKHIVNIKMDFLSTRDFWML